MATPTEKAPGINAFISKLMGKDRTTTIERGECMACEFGATEFRDDLSRKEYSISGMCQACQDSVFGS